MVAAEWTWIIYLAGDNNLEGAGREDLKEMQEVGSSERLHLIVQFDSERNGTTRYRVEKGALATIETIPGVNTGDPKVLADFIAWASQKYPARRYLVDIWNHGAGWENLPPDYNYEELRNTKPVRSAKVKRLKRAIFRTTAERILARPGPPMLKPEPPRTEPLQPQLVTREGLKLKARRPELLNPELKAEVLRPELAPRPDHVSTRAIAIDTGSHDYLDNQELRHAMSQGLGASKADILGCDACLMNMLEIAYEMRTTALYMVGSEQTEPGAGWPYAAILKKLAAAPEMAPRDLATTIATEYGAWYHRHGSKSDASATQSALDLTKLKQVVGAVDELASALIAELPSVGGAIALAVAGAQTFQDFPEYVDLGSLATQLRKKLPADSKAKGPAAALKDACK